ncbi:hypothetical protein KGF54_005603 [Candida jiufengensis]|uniref:uncharacterized protein n=1 Tax=Candida jiufengensis TaxID=497108 RepID=UPI0022242902|nr:uncharacterized protein KGF54_005603 [Candida jiufengensis]KAI5949368.1 hypothetical protein KGF54_005603 [Candida jiufengensis]
MRLIVLLLSLCQISLAFIQFPNLDRRDDDLMDEDCKGCVSAEQILSERCGSSATPQQESEVHEFYSCVCRLPNEFFRHLSHCAENCDEFEKVNLNYDEKYLRNEYCRLADRISSIISELQFQLFTSEIGRINTSLMTDQAAETTTGRTQGAATEGAATTQTRNSGISVTLPSSVLGFILLIMMML